MKYLTCLSQVLEVIAGVKGLDINQVVDEVHKNTYSVFFGKPE